MMAMVTAMATAKAMETAMAIGNGRGSAHKIVKLFLPQTSFLELGHVYVCYIISHVKFG